MAWKVTHDPKKHQEKALDDAAQKMGLDLYFHSLRYDGDRGTY